MRVMTAKQRFKIIKKCQDDFDPYYVALACQCSVKHARKMIKEDEEKEARRVMIKAKRLQNGAM